MQCLLYLSLIAAASSKVTFLDYENQDAEMLLSIDACTEYLLVAFTQQ